jgi:high-affinity nickel-transport protein
VVDSANGLWIASLLKRADERARAASRWMSVGVGTLSLLVAMLGAGRYLLPDVENWMEGRELGFGLAVVGVLTVVFVVTTRVLRPAASAAPRPSTETRRASSAH